MIALRFALPQALAVLVLVGCNTPSPRLLDFRASVSAQAAAEEHRRLAADHEAQGRWADALREWRIVHALSPTEQRPVVEVQRLQKQIARLSQRRYQEAVAARAKGNRAGARLAALRALALDPDHKKAMKLLRSLRSVSVKARLAAAPKISNRPTEAYALGGGEQGGNAAFAPEPTLRRPVKGEGERRKAAETVNPTGVKPNNLRLGIEALSREEFQAALRHFETAQRLQEASRSVLDRHINEARQGLADRYYQAGVAKFRASRYADAAADFRRALEYAPSHSKARLYLSSATKLQQ